MDHGGQIRSDFGFLQNPGRSLLPGPQSKREKLLRISLVEHEGPGT